MPSTPPSPDRRLILASQSPARLRILREAGFAPEPIVSGVDEDAIEAELAPSGIDAVVEALAVAKAAAVAATDEVAGGPAAIVIGCDSMLDVDGVAHGKPATVDEARARLRSLRGRSAVLRTGHCVIDTGAGRQAAGVRSTTVRFGTFTDDELEAYLATGEALAVAGSFTLDGRSAPFMDGIDGDHGNVIGLSLPLVRQLLASIDVPITGLWAR